MNTMKAPKLEELYSDGPHLGSYSYEIGEPNLQLEKIYGIESSIRYNVNSFNISLTTFYNYSPYYYQMNKMGECEEEFVIGESHPCAGADFIEWGSGPSGWLIKYQTEGVKSIIKGLEFNLNYDYQNFMITYDFSLVRGDNLTNGLPLSYINPDKHILILKYQKIIMNYKLRLSKIHSQNRLGEFESYTPSTFLVDFILGYSKKNQNISIQFNNILNEEYYNHLSKLKSIAPEAGSNIVLNYKIFF
jgi:iron complex outermembrane recepter protein